MIIYLIIFLLKCKLCHLSRRHNRFSLPPFFAFSLVFALFLVALVLHSHGVKRKRKCCTTYATQQLGEGNYSLCVCVCRVCVSWLCVKINFIAYFSAPNDTPAKRHVGLFVLCERDGENKSEQECLHMRVCIYVCVWQPKVFACCHSIKLGKSRKKK